MRYYLTANMPEMRDTDWDWNEFVARNNNELVATWGNLANRVLSFAYKHWEGRVPPVEALRPADLALLAAVEAGFQSVGKELEAVHLRAALQEAMRLATEVNRYLDSSAPWFEIKTDKAAAAQSVYTGLKAINSLKILLAPFLPFSSEKLHAYLGYDGSIFGESYTETRQDALGAHTVLRYRAPRTGASWKPSGLAAGAPLRLPGPSLKSWRKKWLKRERIKLGK